MRNRNAELNPRYDALMVKPRGVIHFESVPMEPTSSITIRHFRQRCFPFRWHFHPEAELTLIVKGRGLRFVGDSIGEFREGDLCLLPGNLPHTWSSQAETGSVHSICIQLAQQAWADSLLRLPECRPVSELLFNTARRGVHVVGKTAAKSADILVCLGTKKNRSVDDLALLLQALNTIASHPCDQRPLSTSELWTNSASSETTLLQTVLNTLSNSIGDVLPSQRTIAAMLSMSPGGFSRFFQRLVGKRYIDYINEWRIGLACRTLIETDDAILDVALSSGFENLANFHRRFRRHKGMTPREFRRKCRATEYTSK